MEIGCSTVLFREFELKRALEAIRRIGYEYIETQGVGPWCPHVDIDSDDPVAFADTVKSFGFKGVTALWMRNGTIISNEKSVDYAIRSIKWAAAAGIKVVNTGDGHKPEGMSESDAYQVLGERVDKILDGTAGLGVRLAIEPHGTFSLTLEGLKKIMALASADRLGVNYDAANIHRSGYVESRHDASAYQAMETPGNEAEVLKGIASRVVHFHAKDLDRNRNCVALGTGEVRLAECVGILKKANYAGVVSLETEGGLDLESTVKLAAESYRFLKRVV